MAEKTKKAPPPMKTLKPKDYQELRSLLSECQTAMAEATENSLKEEEWDEAFKELDATGEFSTKYKDRITTQKLKVRPGKPVLDDEGNPVKNDDGTIKIEPDMTKPEKIRVHYIDNTALNLRKNLARIGRQHDKLILSLIGKRDVIKAMHTAQELLKEPEVKQELKKVDEIGNLAPWGGMASAEWLLILNRIFNAGKSKAGNPGKGKISRIMQPTPGNRHEICQTREKGNDIITTWDNGKGSKISFEIADADRLINGRYFIRNLFFTLQKMNDQAFPDIVTISLEEMVKLKMYTRTDGALRGMRTFFRNQKKITLNGEIKKKGKGKIYAGTDGTEKGIDGGLFTHLLYDKGSGYVRLVVDPCFNTKFMAPYFTLFPRDAYRMSEKALSLTYYIFYLARQHTKEIKKTGSFKVKMDTVRNFLGFPDVDEVNDRKYKKYIIDPIDRIIDEIESVIGQTPEAKDRGFTITPYVQYTGNIRDYLNGWLEIGLSGENAEMFIEIAEKSEKEQRKRERAIEKAKAKMIAKKQLEAEKKAPKK